ncbi:hypothetical protein EX895_002291 [Sporisorium graminicola]|uniref:Kinetochore protein mis13 n=1 Tax=Sporisorium graminicola TaxID=280036 RepID=A0A4U7KVW8_9BASI|nr:hypothetical protein EX895_002291 [Sporisorium graminicola]TKY88660.1 hypothetical protein EX895_002291 [Sporisorium graminicola]
MSTQSRRSTRLSTSDNDDGRVSSSSSSKRKSASSSSTSSSTRSSAASSGVIPTVAARNASNKRADRKERRLEDLLDDTFADDDARRLDLSMGAFQPVKSTSTSIKRTRQDAEAAARKIKQASSRRDEPPKTKRKLRETLADESDDDFVFSREPVRRNGAAAPSSSSSSSSASASAATRPPPSRNGAPTSLSGRTVFEPLPDAAGGETPIIRRNQAFRAGLENNPRRPTGREAEQQARRSSLTLKGQRRVPSLRDGTVAYPHEDVPDHELFRHCRDTLPPVVRMKHLVGWILKRSFDIASGKKELPVRPRDAAKKSKGKAKESNELPIFTEVELKLVRSRDSELTAVLEQLLTDLNDGVFGVNWMGQGDETDKKLLQPHPRNESNRKAAAQLSAIVEAMRSESQAWSKELTRLEDYEAETARLEALLEQDGIAESGDVIAWDRADLDEAGLQQLRDAEAAVDWLQRLQGGGSTEAAKPKSRSKGRTSKAAAARQDDEADLKGTEHDPRWSDVEFNVDLLRSQSHQFAQLESLAGRYIRTVSAHAAQALRDRTSSSSALAGAASSSAKGGRRRKSGTGSKNGQGGDGGNERLEMLLSGVRESRSVSQPGGSAARPVSAEADQSAADVSASMVAVEPDESDPTDLLRALARMPARPA